MSRNSDQIQVVMFSVEGAPFAFEISQVERILRYQQPRSLPNAAEFLEGVVSFGDAVVPVVDLRTRLGLPPSRGDETRIVVLRIDEHPVGVVVDEVSEVYRLDATAVAPPPEMVRGLAARYISGIIQRDETTVVLLNAGRLFSSEEKIQLTGIAAGETA